MDNQKDMNQKDTEITPSLGVPNAVALSMHNLALFQSKSLKMASALHLVTELFSETEPIRTALREQAIALVLVVADRRIMESTESIDGAQYVLDTTMSLITVLNNSRLLSDMNAGIITTELESLKTLLGSIAIPSAKLSELVLHDLFSSSVAPITSTETSNTVPSKISHFAPSLNVPEKKSATLPSAEQVTRPSAVIASKTNTDSFKKTLPVVDKADRKDQILNAITKEGSSIKDISLAVKGCSEKTIQRELNSMIEKGQIERIGEKRWSVYKRT